jgi:hypothetical protein
MLDNVTLADNVDDLLHGPGPGGAPAAALPEPYRPRRAANNSATEVSLTSMLDQIVGPGNADVRGSSGEKVLRWPSPDYKGHHGRRDPPSSGGCRGSQPCRQPSVVAIPFSQELAPAARASARKTHSCEVVSRTFVSFWYENAQVPDRCGFRRRRSVSFWRTPAAPRVPPAQIGQFLAHSCRTKGAAGAERRLCPLRPRPGSQSGRTDY